MKSFEKPPVIAHRGNRSLAPENTLLAAEAGFAAGADWWELDVAESADGILVVIHDDSLVRTTDAQLVFPGRDPWTVYDFGFDELRSLDAGSWYLATDPFLQVASGAVSPAEREKFPGLKIPTLKECLELTKKHGKKVNIEIKSATGHACDGNIVEKTVALVRELGMNSSVLVSSFNHDYLKRVKKADPGMETAALIDDPLPDPVSTLKELGAVALNPNGKKLDRETVEKVRKAGFGVYVWTVNEDADMKKMLEWGVSGLITDFTERARRVTDLI